MSNQSYISNSDIYLQFKELDKTSLRSIVYYYEKNRESLYQLDVKEYFEILVTYGNAVFDLGMYTKFLRIADEILFLSIEHNIFEFDGEDIYCSTLFKKAAAHYNLQQKDKAEYILEQALRIYPENKFIINFYKKILARHRSLSSKTRGLAVLLILASAVVIALELLVIRPFYDTLITPVEYSRYGLLGAGLCVYLLGEFAGWFSIEWNVRLKLNEIKRKRALQVK